MNRLIVLTPDELDSLRDILDAMPCDLGFPQGCPDNEPERRCICCALLVAVNHATGPAGPDALDNAGTAAADVVTAWNGVVKRLKATPHAIPWSGEELQGMNRAVGSLAKACGDRKDNTS